MAYLEIVKSGNSLTVDMNIYKDIDKVSYSKVSFHKADVTQVKLKDDHVEIYMLGIRSTWEITWDQTYEGSKFLIVDSIDEVALTSEEDLFNKIIALR